MASIRERFGLRGRKGSRLSPAQEGVLAELRARGIAIVSWDELIGDPALWQRLQAEMDAFVRIATADDSAAQAGQGKDYLLRGMPHGTGEKGVLQADGPWLELGVGDALLGIVNAYRGFETKLFDFDQWYTVPVGENRERIVSQQWHRDSYEPHIVKVFLYFSDVDEEAGPFEYVAHSVEGDKYGHLWPWQPGESRYPPTEALDESIPDSDRVSAMGPPGTVVICDTGGFHRGGYALHNPRILSVYTYVNPESVNVTKKRKFRVDGPTGSLSETARYALS